MILLLKRQLFSTLTHSYIGICTYNNTSPIVCHDTFNNGNVYACNWEEKLRICVSRTKDRGASQYFKGGWLGLAGMRVVVDDGDFQCGQLNIIEYT